MISPFTHYNQANQYTAELVQTTNTIRSIDSLDVGTAEKTCIYKEDKLKLYRFTPTHGKRISTPLLICYALVNRHYMTDLDEKRSLVRRLLAEGIDLYLIDWGYPDPADRYLDLDDYINGYLHNCVEQIKQYTETQAIHLLGICQGGVLSLCYTALHPHNIRNLVTMVAPFDFSKDDNTLAKMAKYADVYAAHQAFGNFQGSLLNANFTMLNPINLNMIKYVKAANTLRDQEQAKFFLRMEKWINDSPDQAGSALSEFVTKLYQKNQLVTGDFTVGDVAVNLAQVTHPVLNIYGELDHIVPPSATKALKELIPTKDYTELSIKTGHIGMYVSGKSGEIPPQIAQWLSARV